MKLGASGERDCHLFTTSLLLLKAVGTPGAGKMDKLVLIKVQHLLRRLTP